MLNSVGYVQRPLGRSMWLRRTVLGTSTNKNGNKLRDEFCQRAATTVFETGNGSRDFYTAKSHLCPPLNEAVCVFCIHSRL